MFEKGFSSNRQKINGCSFLLLSSFCNKIWVGFCLTTGKHFLRGFILKPAEKVLLKNGARDFQNSPPSKLRDWLVFIWQSLIILNVFNSLTTVGFKGKSRGHGPRPCTFGRRSPTPNEKIKNWKRDFLILSRRKKQEGKKTKKISMISEEKIWIRPVFF